VSRVRFEGVERRWPDGTYGLRGLDLEVADGELLVFVGPSGCGKSTTLRLLAGLDRPTAGRLLLGDRDVTDLPPQDRDVAMVFQNYALYPHKSVRDNLAFPLKMRGVRGAEAERRVAEAAALLDLGPLLDRKPAQLSGGQRQRVALGRAIARLQRRLHATLLYVTHDQEEAMTLGDRVALLRDGTLQQLDTPLALYERPVNTFVARFMGSPAMNLLPPEGLVPSPPDTHLVGVRPHDLAIGEPADLRRRVEVIEPVGSHLIAHLSGDLVAVLPADAGVREDDVVGLRLRRDRLHFFDARGERLPG
jgi:multiple sugar transport system ATP-binding protein